MANVNVMRQVQAVVGVMVLAGVGLGFFVTPWFFLLDVMAGLGLIQASLSGVCPMENLLAKMPWNRAGK